MENIMKGTYQPPNNNINQSTSSKQSPSKDGEKPPRHVKFRSQHMGPNSYIDDSDDEETASICFQHTNLSDSNVMKIKYQIVFLLLFLIILKET